MKKVELDKTEERTEENKEEAIECWGELFGNKTNIARRVGVSRITLYNWIEGDKSFAKKVKQAEENMKDFIEDALYLKVKEGDTKAILFACERKCYDRGYGKRQIIDLNNRIGELPPEKQKEIDDVLKMNGYQVDTE
jgi:hypothetical protein